MNLIIKKMIWARDIAIKEGFFYSDKDRVLKTLSFPEIDSNESISIETDPEREIISTEAVIEEVSELPPSVIILKDSVLIKEAIKIP